MLSISHHSVHTADVAADDSDNADDDCEVRTLVKEKRPQAGPTDNNREVYVSVRLATVLAGEAEDTLKQSRKKNAATGNFFRLNDCAV